MKVGWAINAEQKTAVIMLSTKESKLLKEIVANLKPNEVLDSLRDEGLNVTKDEISVLLDCLYKGLSS